MEEFVKSHFIFWFSAKFSSNFYIYSHLLKKLHNIMLKKVEKYADKKFKKGNIVPKRIALLPFLALMNKYVNYVFKKL